MINLLEWPRSLFYQTREFDAKNDDGLLSLLKDIYARVESQGVIFISLPQALNAAYALAVAIYNSPGAYYQEQYELFFSTESAMQECLGFANPEAGFLSEKLMCGVMTYYILYLQANKSMDLACYLVQFKQMLLSNRSYIEYEEQNLCKAEYVEPMLHDIEAIEERFYSDLTPATQEACKISDRVWRWIAAFSDEEFEYLLALNDGKNHQHEMLDMAKEKFSPFSKFMERGGLQMLIINDNKYLEYSRRVEEGDFLNMPKNLVRPADDTTLSREFTADGASLEDLYKWHCKSIENSNAKYAELHAQWAAEHVKNEFVEDKMARDALELVKIQSLSDKVMRENEQLKADYAQLKEHYENLQMAYDEILDERYGDQELVSEPDNIDWQLQEEARLEYEESVADSISHGLKKVIRFCVKYAHDTGNVLDNELNHFKQMMDDLLDSDLAVNLKASDQLDLYKEIGKINEGRKAHLAALVKEQLQSQQEEKAQSLFEHLHVNGEQVIVGGNGEYKNEAIDYDTRRNIGSGGEAEG